MEKINLYKLSKKAEGQYRLDSKRKNELPNDVLERRISSFIYASTDRYYYSDADFVAAFGGFIITVLNNEVAYVKWTKDSHKGKPLDKELRRKDKAFEYFGLNKEGTDFLEKNENEEYESTLLM